VALLAGTDFFTAEVLTLRGLVTYYVLFFIHLESRRVDIAGLTVHPDEAWMKQIARNATADDCGALRDCRYLLHDRDTKFTRLFRAILVSGRVRPLALPPHSPNLNAYAERWVRSVKEECLSKVILFGERALRRAEPIRRPFPCGTDVARRVVVRVEAFAVDRERTINRCRSASRIDDGFDPSDEEPC